MADLLKFPQGVKTPDNTNDEWWQTCPECGEQHWENQVDQEEWTYIKATKCVNCGFFMIAF